MNRQNAYCYPFLIPYLLLLAVGVGLLLLYDKASLHLAMNAYHTKGLDIFFRYFTEIGGGTMPFVFIALLLLYRYSLSLYLLTAQFVGGILSFVGKRIFDKPRPFLYFQEHLPDVHLPLVEGVKIHYSYSFPSGHTITAFALFFALLLVLKDRRWSLVMLLLALLVGYSRIYLSQHFAVDVLVGSIVGTLSAYYTYPLYQKMDTAWGHRSLKDFFVTTKIS